MTSPPRGEEGGSPKGDITLKADKAKEVTRGRRGGDVIYERPQGRCTLDGDEHFISDAAKIRLL